MLRNTKHRIAIGTIFIAVALITFGFQPKPITGKTESKSSAKKPGLIPDPFELYQTIPAFHSEMTSSDLPGSYDLSAEFPLPGDQGIYKDNVGYSVGYGLISYLEAKKKGIRNLSSIGPSSANGQKILYSPNFIYNQLNSGKDQAISLLDGLVLAESRGSVTLEIMNESSSSFRTKPKANIVELGRKARLRRIYRIEPHDLTTVKLALAEKRPVLIGYLVYENFRDPKPDSIFEIGTGEVLGAQSLVVLGYNDKKKAFKVWNSWGTTWGDHGYLWISYETFPKYTKSAYVADSEIENELLTQNKLNDALESLEYGEHNLFPPKEVFASRGDFSDRIRISWSREKRAIGYEVYRKRKIDSKYQLVGLSKQAFFEDFGIQKSTAYNYRVASLDENFLSKPSLDSNDGYAVDPTKPAGILPVTNLQASVVATNDRILLEWDPQPISTTFAVYKWNPVARIYRFLGKTEKTTYIDLKASRNGDSEIYQVIPERNQLIGESSSYVSAHLDPSEVLKPRPKNLTASKGLYADATILQWEGSPSAVAYHIFRKTNGQWKKIAKTMELQFKDNDNYEKESFYAVASEFEGELFSLPSEPDIGFPSLVAGRSMGLKPPELTVSENRKTGEFLFSWNVVPKVTSYKVYMRKKNDPDWSLVKETSESNFKLQNLTKNQFYFFAIQSISKGVGESLFSKPVTSVISDTVLDVKKVKTFGESAIQKFIGPWTAMYWDGKNKVKPVRLTIEAEDVEGNIIMKWNENQIFRGKNIVDSDLLEEKGKWKIKLSPNYESLSGEFEDKGLVPEKSQLSFIRE
ncbi:fibronectin type III domain-containing protein [Leptospira vanthielii]|uniref:Fibronectin type III domain protein n=1 Tax=Leptospira vanthielii serovar Holland str. Waz Holland = ATCC 700522 TaxID=1218591 RepID=N1WAC6_9LEPT|nr:fibronectin type III domain-containing protein [Leptospira vanthielii]EMY70142.1 fibronectin type III domain protein [Leptospira vanthielii serovar Holland str. Waz Holland = ATCC 700522]